MKRLFASLASVGIVVAIALGVFRVERTDSGERQAAPAPSVSASAAPVPNYFRQNQPRHWRYVMLAPTR